MLEYPVLPNLVVARTQVALRTGADDSAAGQTRTQRSERAAGAVAINEIACRLLLATRPFTRCGQLTVAAVKLLRKMA